MAGTYTCLYRDLQHDVTLLLHARFTTRMHYDGRMQGIH
jgi:hypothetical protein